MGEGPGGGGPSRPLQQGSNGACHSSLPGLTQDEEEVEGAT